MPDFILLFEHNPKAPPIIVNALQHELIRLGVVVYSHYRIAGLRLDLAFRAALAPEWNIRRRNGHYWLRADWPVFECYRIGAESIYISVLPPDVPREEIEARIIWDWERSIEETARAEGVRDAIAAVEKFCAENSRRQLVLFPPGIKMRVDVGALLSFIAAINK